MLAIRFDSGPEHDRRRAAAAKLMHRFYEIIDSKGGSMSDAAVAELEHIGEDFNGVYSALVLEAVEQDVKMWKMVFKFHLWQHLAEWVPRTWGNPRFVFGLMPTRT